MEKPLAVFTVHSSRDSKLKLLSMLLVCPSAEMEFELKTRTLLLLTRSAMTETSWVAMDAEMTVEQLRLDIIVQMLKSLHLRVFAQQSAETESEQALKHATIHPQAQNVKQIAQGCSLAVTASKKLKNNAISWLLIINLRAQAHAPSILVIPHALQQPVRNAPLSRNALKDPLTIQGSPIWERVRMSWQQRQKLQTVKWFFTFT